MKKSSFLLGFFAAFLLTVSSYVYVYTDNSAFVLQELDGGEIELPPTVSVSSVVFFDRSLNPTTLPYVVERKTTKPYCLVRAAKSGERFRGYLLSRSDETVVLKSEDKVITVKYESISCDQPQESKVFLRLSKPLKGFVGYKVGNVGWSPSYTVVLKGKKGYCSGSFRISNSSKWEYEGEVYLVAYSQPPAPNIEGMRMMMAKGAGGPPPEATAEEVEGGDVLKLFKVRGLSLLEKGTAYLPLVSSSELKVIDKTTVLDQTLSTYVSDANNLGLKTEVKVKNETDFTLPSGTGRVFIENEGKLCFVSTVSFPTMRAGEERTLSLPPSFSVRVDRKLDYRKVINKRTTKVGLTYTIHNYGGETAEVLLKFHEPPFGKWKWIKCSYPYKKEGTTYLVKLALQPRSTVKVGVEYEATF